MIWHPPPIFLLQGGVTGFSASARMSSLPFPPPHWVRGGFSSSDMAAPYSFKLLQIITITSYYSHSALFLWVVSTFQLPFLSLHLWYQESTSLGCAASCPQHDFISAAFSLICPRPSLVLHSAHPDGREREDKLFETS